MISTERQYVRTYAAERRMRKILGEMPAEPGLLGAFMLGTAASLADIFRDEIRLYEEQHDRGRKGAWMPTYSGRRFWFLDPRPGDFDIGDIAQGLSRINRWNGATTGGGLTVAQHCSMAAAYLPRKYALSGLLHDSVEAYTGDVIAPYKELLGETHRAVEDAILGAIMAQYGAPWDEEARRAVKRVDNRLLATEIRDIVPSHLTYQEVDAEPYPEPLSPWGPDVAREVYLQLFRHFGGRQDG